METFRLRSHSQPTPGMEAGRTYLHSITKQEQNSFPVIDTFQLLNSRLNRHPHFVELVKRIVEFNNRLDQWRVGRAVIPKLLYTYNLYINLVNRLRTIWFATDEQVIVRDLKASYQWFIGETTPPQQKQKGNYANILQAMRKLPEILDNKDNMHMYNQKNRTAHPEFRPPRDRVSEFKRKQLITPSTDVTDSSTLFSNTKFTFFSEKKTSNTKTPFLKSNQKQSATKATAIGEMTAEKEIGEQGAEIQLDEAGKPIQKEQQPELIPQDIPAGEAEEYQEVSEYEDERKEMYKKAYSSAYQPNTKFSLTERTSLANMQRRVVIMQSNEYRQKIEDEKQVNRVAEWAKTKSKITTQINRKLERRSTGNMFALTAFKNREEKKLLEDVQELEPIANRFAQTQVIGNKKEGMPGFKRVKHVDSDPRDRDAVNHHFANKQDIRFRNRNLSEGGNKDEMHLEIIEIKARGDSRQRQMTPAQETSSRKMSSSNSDKRKSLVTITPIQKLETDLIANSKSEVKLKIVSATGPILSSRKDESSNFLARAKDIEREIRENKLANTIGTFSKYIKHTADAGDGRARTSHNGLTSSDSASLRKFQTLTGTTRKRANSFGEILYRNQPDRYNAAEQDVAEKIKSAMSSRGVSVSNNLLLKSLNVPNTAIYSHTDNLYRSGQRLISNPWFPKTKPKKKKKKK